MRTTIRRTLVFAVIALGIAATGASPSGAADETDEITGIFFDCQDNFLVESCTVFDPEGNVFLSTTPDGARVVGSEGGGPGGANSASELLNHFISTSANARLQRRYSISDRIGDAFFDRLAADPSVEPPTFEPWLESSYRDVDDDRWGRDSDGEIWQFLGGVDMRVDENLIVGVAGGYEDGDFDTFGDFVEEDYDTWLVGPYAAYLITPNLFADLWVGYARDDVDIDLGVLGGDYDVDRWFIDFNLTGQWEVGPLNLRPRLSAWYAEDDRESFNFSIPGSSSRIRVDSDDENYGSIAFMIEANKAFGMADGLALVPFARMGVHYAYERANSGRLLGDDLETHSSSAYTGDARIGVRIVSAGSVVVEASAGYLSIGKNDLDVIEGRISAGFYF